MSKTHGQAAAIWAAAQGHLAGDHEVVCRAPDIYNAPYLGWMVTCKFQYRHHGPHSWVEDPMGPRHPEESELQHARLRENARRLQIPFIDPLKDPLSAAEWRARFPYRSEEQRAVDFATQRAKERARP